MFGGAAISRGRVFFVTTDAVYAIGPKQPTKPTGWAVNEPAVTGEGAAAYVQVSPTELVLEPGRTVKLTARSFDSRGRFLREEKATWSLDGLKGTVADGAFTVGADRIEQAGLIKATVGTVTGEARARVVRPLPWDETFESMPEKSVPAGWVNAGGPLGPLSVVDARWAEGAAEDAHQHPLQTRTLLHRPGRVVELHDAGRRARADTAAHDGRRRCDGAALQPRPVRDDAAAQARAVGARNAALAPWCRSSGRPTRGTRSSCAWRTCPTVQVRARGKAWPAGQPEPAAWQIDKTDPIGNRQGAPGFFIDAEFGAYIDNLKLTQNE